MKTKNELTEELILRIEKIVKFYANQDINKDYIYHCEVDRTINEIKITCGDNYFTNIFLQSLYDSIGSDKISFCFKANRFFTGIVINLDNVNKL